MAKFSIKNTVESGLSAFFQHLGLMLMVGLTLGVTQWGYQNVPRMVARKLGVVSIQMPQKLATSVKMENKHNSKLLNTKDTLHNVGEKIGESLTAKAYAHIGTSNKSDLLMIAVVWIVMLLLWIFVLLGTVRVALDIVNKNKSSYSQLFSQSGLMLRYVGLGFVYILLTLCIMLGSSVAGGLVGVVVGVPLSLLGFSLLPAYFVGSFVWIGVTVYFLMRYMLGVYCMVDKNLGIHKSLSCSYELTKGSVVKLLLLFVLMMIPAFMFMGIQVHISSAGFSAHAIQSAARSPYYTLFSGFLGVLYGLWFAHVYKTMRGRG